MIGEEEEHVEIIKEIHKNTDKKENNSVLDILDVPIGVAHGEEKKKKVITNTLDFGQLNQMPLKEQVRTLKREYLNLF